MRAPPSGWLGSTATLLEWDDNIPSFDEVHGEALKANCYRDTSRDLAEARASNSFEEVHA